MRRTKARKILIKAYGSRADARESCFGDCCLTAREKKALITVIYGREEDS